VIYQGHYLKKGTWVIPMDQEFGELARQLLEPQAYPDLREFPDGPPEQPYDAAGWTLGFQMGVRVIEGRVPLSDDVRAAMSPVRGTVVAWDAEVEDAATFDAVPGVGFDGNEIAAGITPRPGRITGTGGALAIDPAQNNTFRALNEAWTAGATVGLAADGRYVMSGIDDDVAGRWASELALNSAWTDDPSTALPRSRLGLFRPWRPSMDEGWTRWVLERYGFESTNLRDQDVREGDLRDRFDVLVLPSERPLSLIEGFADGSTRSEYTGGLGPEGLEALDRFVRDGGTLVALNQSSDLVIEALDLPVRNAVADLSRGEFFTGGSILEVTTDRTHPVMAGMPERAAVFVQSSPVFEALPGFEGRALAVYAQSGSPLMSGYLLGEEHLHGRAAAVEVEHGRGRVILIGFRPQWRGQPFGTFRVLFNAALYHGSVAEERRGTPGFWPTEAGVATGGFDSSYP
jgi:hypothetical protein